MPISKAEGTAKGISLYYMLKSKLPQPMTEKETEEEFKGSSGWWWNFCNRMNLKSQTLQGEAASADHEEASKYPDKLRQIIEEGGYTEDQIFNVDEAGLWWKIAKTKIVILGYLEGF